MAEILPGDTPSVVDLCKSWGYPTEERKIRWMRFLKLSKKVNLEKLGYRYRCSHFSGRSIKMERSSDAGQSRKIGPLSQKLYDTITGIQLGKIEDTFHWTLEVK
jgi:branched-chain amino acid aminotransferase